MPLSESDPLRFPYHPDYGMPDQWREETVNLARQHGVPTAAAKTGCHPSTIYRWVRDSKE
jgi:hypothetical protein